MPYYHIEQAAMKTQEKFCSMPIYSHICGCNDGAFFALYIYIQYLHAYIHTILTYIHTYTLSWRCRSFFKELTGASQQKEKRKGRRISGRIGKRKE